MEDVLIHGMEEPHCVYCCDIQNVGEIGFRMCCLCSRVVKCSSPCCKVAKCLHMTWEAPDTASVLYAYTTSIMHM